MDSVHSQLVARALSLHESGRENSSNRYQRTIIALAGPPGSGKTTIAAEVAQLLNASAGRPGFAIVVPVDGFHLSRSALDALPNRDEAYARRGAAWTFDAQGVLDLVSALQRSKSSHETKMKKQKEHNDEGTNDIQTKPVLYPQDRGIPTESDGLPKRGIKEDAKAENKDVILAPSFDHATKDPCLDAICIGPENSIVILEGLWLLYDQDPWCRIRDLVDETWFVDVDPGLARDRVARRHLQSGIESTWEAAVGRAEGNDLANGEIIRSCLVEPAFMVVSVEAAAAVS